MKNQEELYILKKVLIHKWLEDTEKDPAKVRQENNQITDFFMIRSVFNQLNEKSHGKQISIPISFFLSSRKLDASCEELIKFAKTKQIQFDKEMNLDKIYLLEFKPIRGANKIAISLIDKINDMGKKRTRKYTEFELILDLKYKENNFTAKDMPHYLIVSEIWIEESAKRTDSVLISLYDIFDKKKYHMGLDVEVIEQIKEYDSFVREKETLEYFDEKEKMKKRKVVKKRLKKLRKKQRQNSAKKLQKWYRKNRKRRRRNSAIILQKWHKKNRVYNSNLIKIKMYFKKLFAKKIQKWWKFVIKKKKQIMIKKKNKCAKKIQNWWFKIIVIKHKRLENIINLRKKKITSKSSQRYNPNAPEYIPKNEPS